MGKFGIEKNGYNKKEVNLFVEDVIKQTEKMIDKIEKQQIELNYYKESEDAIKKAMIEAEKTSLEIKNQAQTEQKKIIDEARKNASTIVNEALIKAEEIEKESEMIKHHIIELKDRINELIKQQTSILKEIELIEEKK